MSSTLRICSLLPSTTEIVCALGLSDNLVGITHECDYPPEIDGITVVTKSLFDHSTSSSYEINQHITESFFEGTEVHSGSGIYALDNEALKSANPDLILTQELCKVCAVSYDLVEKSIKELNGLQTVLSFEPSTVEEILETIIGIGEKTDTEYEANAIVADSFRRINIIKEKINNIDNSPIVLGLEWLDPFFIGGHWVPEMIEIAGGINALGKIKNPSIVVSETEILDAQPNIIVLMVCGFDLEKTINEFSILQKNEFWQKYTGQIYAVDGSAYFSRPGPRIIEGIEILSEIIHPEIFPRRKNTSAWKRIR